MLLSTFYIYNTNESILNAQQYPRKFEKKNVKCGRTILVYSNNFTALLVIVNNCLLHDMNVFIYSDFLNYFILIFK